MEPRVICVLFDNQPQIPNEPETFKLQLLLIQKMRKRITISQIL